MHEGTCISTPKNVQKENVFILSSCPTLAPSNDEAVSSIRDNKNDIEKKEIWSWEEKSWGDESSNEEIWKPIIK